MTAEGAAGGGGELVGRVLGGRYRVTATIGRGGMGVVARAVDELLGREVAVKVMRAYTDASAAELADLRARMQREAQAAARIRHHGVVTVHDVAEEEGLPVIVMELVEGPSLDSVLDERGPLDPREAAAIGARLMDALDAAHRAGVLHRDVKPANVLLEPGGRVVLTDFGIATVEAADEATAKLTRSGQLIGSLDYLAPERAQGREPGPASDIWSLGMTLYAAVEGGSPFRRTSAWSTLSAIVSDPLPEPRRAGPLGPVLRALMAKEPQDRPDAARARAMLERVAAGGSPAPGPAAATAGPGAGPVAGRAAGAPPVPPGYGPAPTPYPQPTPVPMPAPTPVPMPTPPPQPLPSPHAPYAGHAGPVTAPHAGGAAAAGRRFRGRLVVAAAAAAVLAGGGVTYAVVGDDDAGGGRTDRRVRAESPQPAAPSPTPSSGAPSRPAGGKSPAAKPSPKGGASASAAAGPSPVPTTCAGWSHQERSPGSYGYMSGDFHIVTGPYQACPAVALAKSGTKLLYHCFVVNSYGHKWTYVRVPGTDRAGWMSNDNLTRQTGPLNRC
ncbi:serine/threonine-protein kinase [Streptomyces sp. NPDC046866]|uniref:serine/threonine-protein kinase n=1 Tax=Streptomyces sp. NPDC046866 TaxID=3154921 RepID=UPI00345332E5